uniref:Uncharacterized protein n=1 Tax=Cannabis sativa TaxID=3483 RepID=A0A803QMW3_CANSA
MENSNESWKHDLTSFPIWGRAWDVPIDLLTINNTVRMAAKAGEVITVHNSDVSKMEEGKEGTAAYGKWLKVGNGTREGMQGDRQGMGKNNSIDETMQQSPINTGRTTTASSSPSLTTMGDARSGSMKGTENRDTNHDQEQQLIEGGL